MKARESIGREMHLGGGGGGVIDGDTLGGRWACVCVHCLQ